MYPTGKMKQGRDSAFACLGGGLGSFRKRAAREPSVCEKMAVEGVVWTMGPRASLARTRPCANALRQRSWCVQGGWSEVSKTDSRDWRAMEAIGDWPLLWWYGSHLSCGVMWSDLNFQRISPLQCREHGEGGQGWWPGNHLGCRKPPNGAGEQE